MRFYKLNNNSRGDTIVEVLIALGILSFALAVSYAVTNSSIASLNAARTSARASSELQRQIEIVRIKEAGELTNFCVNNIGAIVAYTESDCNFTGIDIKINKSDAKYTATAKWELGGKQYSADMIYEN